MMAVYYGKPVILLIDEYDVPLAKASTHGYCQEMLEVIYYNGEQEVARIRKGHENADNSGNYVGYPEIKNEKIGGLDVSLKEKDGKVVLAIWSDGAYSYSISLDEQGVSLEEMTALVKAVK